MHLNLSAADQLSHHCTQKPEQNRRPAQLLAFPASLDSHLRILLLVQPQLLPRAVGLLLPGALNGGLVLGL